MSYYQLGASLNSKPVSLYRVGTAVGTEGFFGSGWGADIYQEMDSINTELKQFDGELLDSIKSEVSEHPDHSDARVFYSSVWIPFYTEWKGYIHEKTSTWSKLKSAMSAFVGRQVWKDLQEFRDRFVKIHDAAGAVSDVHLTAPAPTPGRLNALESAGGEIRDILSSLFTLLKIVIFGGLVVLGGYVVLHFVGKAKQLKA